MKVAAPAYPSLSDEWDPTNERLWQDCLDVAKGDRKVLTIGGRTINAPNRGRGFRHWPNPKGVAWAVKQYNGFGGHWKRRKEATVDWPTLQAASQGLIVKTANEALVALEYLGLIHRVGQSGGHDLWDITKKGQEAVGLARTLEKRLESLLSREPYDNEEAKALGAWLETNFRFNSPKTPPGQKVLKEALSALCWNLKHGGPERLETLRLYWATLQPNLGNVVKYFSDEGIAVVPKELAFNGVVYLNDIGANEAQLLKYCKRLDAIFNTLKGRWAKAMVGGLKVKLCSPKAFRGTVGGKYKRDEDSLYVRATPSVLGRESGYASFEYIIVHELGHRYERLYGLNDLKVNFDLPEWWTTKYSREDGESFAELFALSHFGYRGTWDQTAVTKFERIFT